ncbi:hypothetical protein HPP92_019331 [Vanilla planifolia]|uniref:Uncharacterized protein n=1 Tax=Vanilla planifolia TaxID=51239 RepID=A0A835Q9D2_VANPL|nr:hypothetical protein HPP92_019331 [Vanilla planifolia]
MGIQSPIPLIFLITKSFSIGVRFKSIHIRLLPSSPPFLSATPTAAAAARCRLMCPPSACPMPNSSPQMEHSCTLAFPSFASPSAGGGPSVLIFLWLARCPPSAWNDGNRLLQVLHSNILLPIAGRLVTGAKGKQHMGFGQGNTLRFPLVGGSLLRARHVFVLLLR